MVEKEGSSLSEAKQHNDAGRFERDSSRNDVRGVVPT